MDFSIDVVIPSIGRDSLEASLRSALDQSCDCNVYVVFDLPGVPELSYMSVLKAERVRLVTTGGGRGGAFSRNLGAEQGQGEFIAFLDDDDVWHSSEKLQQQVDLLKANEACALSLSYAWFVRADGPQRVPLREPYQKETMADYCVMRDSLRYGSTFVQTSTIVVRRREWNTNRWDPARRKHQDWDLAIRLSGNDPGRVCWLRTPTVNVIQASSNSISSTSDWRESGRFLVDYWSLMTTRGRGDFLWAHVARGALVRRDVRGVLWVSRIAAHVRPHPAAVLTAVLAWMRSEFGRVKYALSASRNSKQ